MKLVVFVFQVRALLVKGLQFSNFAIFFGNFDILVDKLHNFVISSARIDAPSFKNLPPILSIPIAFDGFISSSSLRTTS